MFGKAAGSNLHASNASPPLSLCPPCRADRSNYDEHNDEDWENSQFDQETAALVLKVLTAKATQRLLLQLQVRHLACAPPVPGLCAG